jgi:hypothetical protein
MRCAAPDSRFAVEVEDDLDVSELAEFGGGVLVHDRRVEDELCYYRAPVILEYLGPAGVNRADRVSVIGSAIGVTSVSR